MDNERQVLLNRVQVCDFVLLETALFLDSHPDDQQALAHYRKHLEMRKAAAAAYVEQFGPLCQADLGDGARWDWVDGPWPWQNVKEG